MTGNILAVRQNAIASSMLPEVELSDAKINAGDYPIVVSMMPF